MTEEPPPPLQPRAVSVDDACAMFGLSRKTLERLRRHHDFPELKIGTKVIIPVAKAERWFEERIGQDIDPSTPPGSDG